MNDNDQGNGYFRDFDQGSDPKGPRPTEPDSDRERTLREHFEALEAVISLGPVS